MPAERWLHRRSGARTHNSLVGGYSDDRAFGPFLAVLLVIAFHSSRRVDKLLTPGEKRVAVGADLYSEIAGGRTSFESVAADAGDN